MPMVTHRLALPILPPKVRLIQLGSTGSEHILRNCREGAPCPALPCLHMCSMPARLSVPRVPARLHARLPAEGLPIHAQQIILLQKQPALFMWQISLEQMSVSSQ